MKEHYKDMQFVFSDIISKETPEAEVLQKIPALIVAQQTSLKTIIKSVEDIEVNDASYLEGKPNHWLVFAKWKIV